VSAEAHPANTAAHAGIDLPDEILRFRKSERQLHWAVAVPFMICYATALMLVVVYNPDPTRPLRALVSWTHRLSGVGLLLLPLWTVLRHRRDFAVHLRNVGTVWRWRLEDVKWLFLMGLSTVNKRVVLPDQEKFNAGEKLNFMFLTASYPLFIITGFLIWLPGVAFASWILHLSLAAMATPLILGHVFMATVNPDTRLGLQGMITGYVNRHWAQHHYARWYWEHFGHLHRAPEPSQEPALAAVPEVGVEAAAMRHTLDPEPVVVVSPRPRKHLPARGWPGAMQPASPSQAVSETTSI
jgi:formate dehydrogenase subunit gamma